MKRGLTALTLFAACLLLPVLEIYLIIQVAGQIGGWETVGLLVLETILGGWIIRREGRRAWRSLNDTLRTGALPDRGLTDSGLVMAGGVLLIVPGFITDIAGLVFVLPFTRPLVRRLMIGYVNRRLRRMQDLAGLGFGGVPGEPPPPAPPAEPEHPEVIRGEIVREDKE